MFLDMIMSIKQQIVNINGKSQINDIKNRTYYFFNDIILKNLIQVYY